MRTLPSIGFVIVIGLCTSPAFAQGGAPDGSTAGKTVAPKTSDSPASNAGTTGMGTGSRVNSGADANGGGPNAYPGSTNKNATDPRTPGGATSSSMPNPK